MANVHVIIGVAVRYKTDTTTTISATATHIPVPEINSLVLKEVKIKPMYKSALCLLNIHLPLSTRD